MDEDRGDAVRGDRFVLPALTALRMIVMYVETIVVGRYGLYAGLGLDQM